METLLSVLMSLGTVGAVIGLVLIALYAWVVAEAKKISFEGMEQQLFDDPEPAQDGADVHIMPYPSDNYHGVK